MRRWEIRTGMFRWSFRVLLSLTAVETSLVALLRIVVVVVVVVICIVFFLFLALGVIVVVDSASSSTSSAALFFPLVSHDRVAAIVFQLFGRSAGFRPVPDVSVLILLMILILNIDVV